MFVTDSKQPNGRGTGTTSKWRLDVVFSSRLLRPDFCLDTIAAHRHSIMTYLLGPRYRVQLYLRPYYTFCAYCLLPIAYTLLLHICTEYTYIHIYRSHFGSRPQEGFVARCLCRIKGSHGRPFRSTASRLDLVVSAFLKDSAIEDFHAVRHLGVCNSPGCACGHCE